MSNFPSDVRYTKEHEWARLEGDKVRVGVTAHAVDQLGDVTLVDLPAAGTKVTANARFGDIESVKAVSELFSPISGEVVEINAELDASPEKVNEEPYGSGWLVLITPASLSDLEGLMDAAAYQAYLASEAH
jgi:glycine cleavage system H protein